jgi:ABC-type multidrug transport system fused ATPase/permease subunit
MEKSVTNRDVARVMMQHAWRYKGRLFLILATIVVATVADVIQPWYMKRFIDLLSGGSPVSTVVGQIFVTLYIMLGLQLTNWIT